MMTRIDELVATVLPTSRLPRAIRPSLLLDGDVEPPPHLAARVGALRELLRSGGRDMPLTGQLGCSTDVADHYISKLSPEPLETLWVLGLDARNRVRVERLVSKGGPAHCVVTPGDILRVLLVNGCPSGILVHNHPSGVVDPSSEDIELTHRCEDAAAILGLRLLDHLIVGGGRSFSFLDARLLKAR